MQLECQVWVAFDAALDEGVALGLLRREHFAVHHGVLRGVKPKKVEEEYEQEEESRLARRCKDGAVRQSLGFGFLLKLDRMAELQGRYV